MHAFSGIQGFDLSRPDFLLAFLQMPIILRGDFPVRRTPRNMNLPLLAPFCLFWYSRNIPAMSLMLRGRVCLPTIWLYPTLAFASFSALCFCRLK